MSQDSDKSSSEADASQTAKEHHEDGEQETSEARRKALSQVVPLAVGAFMKAQETLSPFSISKAADQLDAISQQQLAPITNFLKRKFPRLQYLNLSSEEPGRFSLVASRESVLSNIVAQYLRLKHNAESPFICPFNVLPVSEGALDAESYDCELLLQPGTVFGRLIHEKPQASVVVSLQSKAISANPLNEVWLFVTSGLKKSEEANFLIDPVFATERKFHPGRIMVIGLNTVFAEVIGNSEYTFQDVDMETQTVEKHPPNQVFKVTLIENNAKVQSQGKQGVARV